MLKKRTKDEKEKEQESRTKKKDAEVHENVCYFALNCLIELFHVCWFSTFLPDLIHTFVYYLTVFMFIEKYI